MQFKDTGLGFGLVTLVAHWVGAALMIGFVVTSISAALLAPAEQSARFALAMSFGYICIPLYLFRMFWRFKHPYPMPLGAASPAQVLIGRGVAFGMLLAGVTLPVLLWAMLTTTGFVATVFFALFWLGLVAFSLGLLLHLFGAFSHHVLQKDETLLRLLGKNVEL